jgi:hypothetical protein
MVDSGVVSTTGDVCKLDASAAGAALIGPFCACLHDLQLYAK